MGLSTVMQTALSGMNAATTILDVTAHNLANYQTRGFKAGAVQLASLPPRTSALGSSQSILVGSGVQVVGVQTDFRQGPIATNSELPLLALDGEGLFILEGHDGERFYTRNGEFRLNANDELATASGDRVLGFGLNADGELDETRLQALKVPIGSTWQSPSGQVAFLRSYSVGKNGRIVGQYSDGTSRTLGQLRLARFANPGGLAARAGNKFVSTAASGLPREASPGDAGAAEITSGATELSNVDLGHELIELTLAGNLFQANLAVFHTAEAMLGSLFFPWRVR